MTWSGPEPTFDKAQSKISKPWEDLLTFFSACNFPFNLNPHKIGSYSRRGGGPAVSQERVALQTPRSGAWRPRTSVPGWRLLLVWSRDPVPRQSAWWLREWGTMRGPQCQGGWSEAYWRTLSMFLSLSCLSLPFTPESTVLHGHPSWGSLCYLTWSKIFDDSSFHQCLLEEVPKCPWRVNMCVFQITELPLGTHVYELAALPCCCITSVRWGPGLLSPVGAGLAVLCGGETWLCASGVWGKPWDVSFENKQSHHWETYVCCLFFCHSHWWSWSDLGCTPWHRWTPLK